MEHILGQWLNPNEEAVGKDLSFVREQFSYCNVVLGNKKRV